MPVSNDLVPSGEINLMPTIELRRLSLSAEYTIPESQPMEAKSIAMDDQKDLEAATMSDLLYLF